MSARGGKSQLSMASLRDKASDLREKASGLPRRKACHWVAQWFTLPQLTTKILSFCLSVVSVSLTLSWESSGVTVQDLDTSTFQFRGRILTFVAVGCTTIVYAIAMTSVGLAGVKVHAKLLTLVSGVVLLLWFFSAPVMSATVTELKESRFARWGDVDVTILEVATIMGFLCKVVIIVDILLAFNQLSQLDNDTEQFSVEVQKSRSTIQAVKSGLSLPLSVSSSGSTGTVLQQRASITSSQRQMSHDRVAMEMEEATLVAEGDDQPGTDDDSAWETI